MNLGPFFDHSSDFLAVGPSGTHRWTVVNAAFATRLGCTPEEVISRYPREGFDPATLSCSDGTTLRVEWKIVPSEGADYWIGREVATELAREIHHRVKNHLQMLVSLLNLQASEASEPRVQTALAIARSRLQSVAKLYEPLYASPDFQWVEFGAYLRSISAEHMEPGSSISTTDVVLDISDALPLALIATDALRSGLRSVELAYATPERVRFTATANSCFELPSRDLIDLLARQLGADLLASEERLSVTLPVSQE